MAAKNSDGMTINFDTYGFKTSVNSVTGSFTSPLGNFSITLTKDYETKSYKQSITYNDVVDNHERSQKMSDPYCF